MINWTCKSFDELSLKEWYNLSMFRQQVFVVEQYCAYLDSDGQDLEAHHLIGRNEEGELLAYARLLPVGVSYKDKTSIGRIASSEKARGTGAGSKLLVQAVKWAEKALAIAPANTTPDSGATTTTFIGDSPGAGTTWIEPVSHADSSTVWVMGRVEKPNV